MPHSIFVRAYTAVSRPPDMIAFDIPSLLEAERIVRNIAHSYRDHGFNADSNSYWFRSQGALHEIYCWPHQ